MLAVPSTPVADSLEFYISLTPVQQIVDDVPGGFAIRSIMTELPSIRPDGVAAETRALVRYGRQ